MSALSSRLREYGRRFKRQVVAYRLMASHPSTPRVARWLLVAAVGYACLPFDLIPDWIPVLGLVDDVVILPLLVWAALRAVPAGVRAECERQAAETAGT